MRCLRASIDHLRIVDPLLATKFVGLIGDLEALTTSVSPIVWLNGGGVNGGEMDHFGRVVVKQRKLFDERNGLILQIRLLPSFENFLVASSFGTLRCAAAHGPVIVVNHCNSRSDIFILFHDYHPPLFIHPTISTTVQKIWRISYRPHERKASTLQNIMVL